ncbi:MAG TPA: hypothetical protein P5556_00490 [Candidatus Gastranaerophilales bacterium]|nr:hypothetical protein [Candidatus Gastranaerophilales bacterium]
MYDANRVLGFGIGYLQPNDPQDFPDLKKRFYSAVDQEQVQSRRIFNGAELITPGQPKQIAFTLASENGKGRGELGSDYFFRQEKKFINNYFENTRRFKSVVLNDLSFVPGFHFFETVVKKIFK